MQFWTEAAIEAIGNSIGNMVVVDDSFMLMHDNSLDQVLMDLYMSKRLFQFKELEQYGKLHTLKHDYLNVSFQCTCINEI